MLQEALVGGAAIDTLRRGLKGLAAIFNSEEFKKLLSGSELIERLKEELQIAQTALEENGFPYHRQFEPVSEKDVPEPIKVGRTAMAVAWNGQSRAVFDPTIWEKTPHTGEAIVQDYFDLGKLHAIPGAKQASEEWEALFAARSVTWRSKGDKGVVTVSGHPYLKTVSPFITAGYTSRVSLPANDPRMHLVQLFLGWLNRLCGKNLKTQFTIERLFVGPRSAYISGKFLFEGVSAEAPGGKAASSFMLDRKMVVGEVRENIYIVMTGAPMTDFGDTYFLRHVERFLTQFQLVDGAAPAAA